MNIEKNLILIKGEDKTEDVKYCKRENGKCNVTFKDNRKYPFSNYNVQWSTKLIELDPQTVIVYHDGIPISGITKIIKFTDLNYIRLIFPKGYNELYPISRLTIEKNTLEGKRSQNCFAYLKELASNLAFKNNNDLINEQNDSGFISKQLDAITVISPSSVLANYLNPKKVKKLNHV